MKRYPEEFKQQVLETLKNETLERTSKLHHVGECTIRRWKKLAEEASKKAEAPTGSDNEPQPRSLGLMLDDMFDPEQVGPARPMTSEGNVENYPAKAEKVTVFPDAFSLLRDQYQSLQLENRRLRRALLALIEDHGIQP